MAFPRPLHAMEREQWLSESTWEFLRKRTWLVDSLWNEVDVAEVSTEAVRLSREIRKIMQT